MPRHFFPRRKFGAAWQGREEGALAQGDGRTDLLVCIPPALQMVRQVFCFAPHRGIAHDAHTHTLGHTSISMRYTYTHTHTRARTHIHTHTSTHRYKRARTRTGQAHERMHKYTHAPEARRGCQRSRKADAQCSPTGCAR